MLRWRNVVLLIICAALAFGGSFTCFASTDGRDDFPSTRSN